MLILFNFGMQIRLIPSMEFISALHRMRIVKSENSMWQISLKMFSILFYSMWGIKVRSQISVDFHSFIRGRHSCISGVNFPRPESSIDYSAPLIWILVIPQGEEAVYHLSWWGNYFSWSSMIIYIWNKYFIQWSKLCIQLKSQIKNFCCLLHVRVLIVVLVLQVQGIIWSGIFACRVCCYWDFLPYLIFVLMALNS